MTYAWPHKCAYRSKNLQGTTQKRPKMNVPVQKVDRYARLSVKYAYFFSSSSMCSA